MIVSRIIHVKVDKRLNVTNKFKYQRRLSIRLAIVMFRGTPCIWLYLDVLKLYSCKPIYQYNIDDILVKLCLLSSLHVNN